MFGYRIAHPLRKRWVPRKVRHARATAYRLGINTSTRRRKRR